MKLDATQKLLGSFALWAIGVGMVISGESFGWNYGWAAIGPLGLLGVTLVVAVMYFSLVKTKIELGCVYPDADGPQSYAFLAYGERFYKLVIAAILVEFVFIVPAVANSIGGYLGFLTNHASDAKWIAAFVVVFCSFSNFFNVKASLFFLYCLTFLALGELTIFLGLV